MVKYTWDKYINIKIPCQDNIEEVVKNIIINEKNDFE